MESGSGSSILSNSQIATLAEHGEERTAAAGETLFEVGDERYPFIAILEGEAAVLEADGDEIVRHGASGFLGEMNLLTGQTAFLGAVATQPMRYIAVEREVLRKLLVEDSSLSDLLLSTFVRRRELLQQREDIGLEIVGSQASAETRRVVEWARAGTTPAQLARSHRRRFCRRPPGGPRPRTGAPRAPPGRRRAACSQPR